MRVDKQHPQTPEVGNSLGGAVCGIGHSKLGQEVKCRTLPCGTLCPNSTSHEADETRRYGQSQTCPAILSRRGATGLLEWIENLLEVLRGNADAGVFHAKVQS